MTKSDGGKFGKTETGTIWLDPKSDFLLMIFINFGLELLMKMLLSTSEHSHFYLKKQ